MTYYQLVRVISWRMSRELPRVKLEKIEAVTHSRVEATTCYEVTQILTHRLSHELLRLIMSYKSTRHPYDISRGNSRILVEMSS